MIKRIKEQFPDKVIWLYSGFYLDEIITDPIRLETVRLCDVLCDERFEITKKDPSLKFVGSSNQRVIDMKKTLEKGYTVLFEEE
ncbi:MAG: radical SAM protein [Allobaculum sp.]|nr:radical SAM protein [Allobaculum sp.]